MASNRRKRRQFTPEYKAEIVKLVHTSDKSVSQLAHDLELTKIAVRAWVKAADDEEKPRRGRTAGRSSSRGPRREAAHQRAENGEGDPKKAAALFAREDS